MLVTFILIFVTETYVDAIHGMKMRLEDTSYETEAEGQKRRKKKPAKFISSESEDEISTKRKVPKKGNKAEKLRGVPQPPIIKPRQTGERLRSMWQFLKLRTTL